MTEQKKLQQEIDGNCSDEEDVMYDKLQHSFPYLDLFIQETLRMFPIGNIACTRRCIASTDVCGIPIEKGLMTRRTCLLFLFASSYVDSIIQMDMYSLHFSSELWGPVDPDVFFPDRHKSKRHRLANVSFGCGPKNCVGQRFALLIIKSTLVRLLRQFTVLPGLHIDQLLDIQERSVITPREVRIRVQRR